MTEIGAKPLRQYRTRSRKDIPLWRCGIRGPQQMMFWHTHWCVAVYLPGAASGVHRTIACVDAVRFRTRKIWPMEDSHASLVVFVIGGQSCMASKTVNLCSYASNSSRGTKNRPHTLMIFDSSRVPVLRPTMTSYGRIWT